MSVEVRIDSRPPAAALGSLRASVGWEPRERNWPRAYDAYACSAAAYDGERLVGWVSIVSDGVHHAFLADVLVHPEYHRRGIGRDLVQRAIDTVAARGVSLFHVDFAEENTDFYRACGFRIGRGGYLERNQS